MKTIELQLADPTLGTWVRTYEFQTIATGVLTHLDPQHQQPRPTLDIIADLAPHVLAHVRAEVWDGLKHEVHCDVRIPGRKHFLSGAPAEVIGHVAIDREGAVTCHATRS